MPRSSRACARRARDGGDRGRPRPARPAGRGGGARHRECRTDHPRRGAGHTRPQQELDLVAHLRFASVYRASDSLEDCEAAITELREQPALPGPAGRTTTDPPVGAARRQRTFTKERTKAREENDARALPRDPAPTDPVPLDEARSLRSRWEVGAWPPPTGAADRTGPPATARARTAPFTNINCRRQATYSGGMTRPSPHGLFEARPHQKNPQETRGRNEYPPFPAGPIHLIPAMPNGEFR